MTRYKLKLILIVIFSIQVTSCLDDKCKRCRNEVYSSEVNPKINEVKEYLSIIRDSLNLSKINYSNYTKYRFTSISSLSRAISILELENRQEKQYLKYKRISQGINYEIKKVEIDTLVELPNNEWNTIEDLIYKYGYWTANEYDNRTVADGWGLIVEGYRPFAASCKKRSDQIIFRGSPDKNDAMGRMASEIDSLMWLKYKNY